MMQQGQPPHPAGRARAGVKAEYRVMLPGLVAEVVFAMLPMLVVSVVLFQLGEPKRILSSPEWSFAASILFGQSVVRFMTGFAHGGRARPGPVALAVTLIIVLGLTPSLMILSAILRADFGGHATQQPERLIQGAQMLFFAISAATFLVLSAIGEAWRLREEKAVRASGDRGRLA
jgi:hypothetical protein